MQISTEWIFRSCGAFASGLIRLGKFLTPDSGAAWVNAFIALVGAVGVFATLSYNDPEQRDSRSDLQVALLEPLSSQNAMERKLALLLSERLDAEFSVQVASVMATDDADADVRYAASMILERMVSPVEPGLLKKTPHKAAYVSDIRKRLQHAGALQAIGAPDGVNRSLRIYQNIVDSLPEGATEALDQSLLAAAQTDQQNGHFDHAARKYRALFSETFWLKEGNKS